MGRGGSMTRGQELQFCAATNQELLEVLECGSDKEQIY